MHSVILKNDAVGDLAHSVEAINNIISSKTNIKVTIFLSKLSQNFSFLVQNPKVEIKILNYHLNIIEKIKLIFFFMKKDIKKVYILSPKSFYFFFPLLFRKKKFFALCINNIGNYRRPSLLLRKFLYKIEINDREKIFKRQSTRILQNKLTTNGENISQSNFKIVIKKSEILKKYLPDDYIYFHYKKSIFSKLGWGIEQLELLFKEFSKYTDNIIFTKDIEFDSNNKLFSDKFNSYNFKTKMHNDRKKNILFFDNIVGEDLFNVIKHSKKVVAFHGMMTNLAFLLKKPVLDLFYCNIESWNDYRKYRNSFYEFKPKYEGYDFIIPKKSMQKTITKIKFSLKKCQKNSF